MRSAKNVISRAIWLFVVFFVASCGGGTSDQNEHAKKGASVRVILSEEGQAIDSQTLEKRLQELGVELLESEVLNGQTILYLRPTSGVDGEQLLRQLQAVSLFSEAAPFVFSGNQKTQLSSAAGSTRSSSGAQNSSSIQLYEILKPRWGVGPFNNPWDVSPLERCRSELRGTTRNPYKDHRVYRDGTNNVWRDSPIGYYQRPAYTCDYLYKPKGSTVFVPGSAVKRYTLSCEYQGLGVIYGPDTGINAPMVCLKKVDSCPAGYAPDSQGFCRGAEPSQVEIAESACQAGMQSSNPIIPSSGEKILRRQDVLDLSPHNLNFILIYRTKWKDSPQSNLGSMWSHNHGANLRQDLNDFSGNALTVQLADGAQRKFVRASATDVWINASHADQLISTTTASGSPAWKYISAKDDSHWVFTPPASNVEPGQLQSMRQRNGWTYIYTYEPDGKLKKVTNHFGRTLQFAYHVSGLLASVAGPDGKTTRYTWDQNKRLISVAPPSESNLEQKYITYVYEDSTWLQYITGIIDENNLRYGTFTYDAAGRATSSTLGANIDQYSVAYSGTAASFNNTAVITDPLGTQRSYGYTQTNGHTDVTAGSGLPGCKGEAPIASRTQTSEGLLNTETDFRGNVTQYTWNSARMLPTGVVRASGTSAAQSTAISLHPTFALPTLVIEPMRTTQYEYDSAGRVLSETVTHTAGSSSGKVQTTTYTYSAEGLLATQMAPNNAVTTYSGHNAAGLPTQVTNPMGHVSTMAYDAAGRLTQVTEANGLLLTLVYNARGWLSTSSRTVGGVTLTTSYTYTPSGQVQSVSYPQGYVITYQHDVAHRVVGWSDNRGQSGNYTLDGLGNVTQEQTTNSGGQVALQVSRQINSINRLQSQTMGNSISASHSYDANGRLISISDADNHSTSFTLDASERIIQISNAMGNAAQFAYNSQDAVTSATDFKGVITNYTRDAQGKESSEQTLDAGQSNTGFDSLNLPVQVTDALGRATTITRDVLGRPTSITYSGSGSSAGQTITSQLRYDLSGTACNANGHPNASKGRLCDMTDQVNGVTHATTQYQWDSFGRLTGRTQTLSSTVADHSLVQTSSYTYVASGPGAGQLASLTYPGGSVLTHAYDATGRLSSMALNGQPLLVDIQYNALEQPLSWTWAFATTPNSLKASRVYNTSGQLTDAGFATFTPNNLGQIASLQQGLYMAGGSDGTQTLGSVPFSAAYNAVGQLTSFSANALTQPYEYSFTYIYDHNGNRTGGSTLLGGVSTSYASTVPSNSNRPTTIAGSNVETNAAGEVTSLLGKTIDYDAAGRVSQVTAVPPCPSGESCADSLTTLSRYNGQNQRYLRDTSSGQTVFTYGPDGYSVLTEVEYKLYGSTTVSNTTETIYLPTASGPMPVVVLVNGTPFAIHSDHLNTPRRLTDAHGRPRWQWAFSGFGEIAAQSVPATNQPTITYSLRYPGQVDDGNGLFYNFNRFYDPRAGRYTQADPIGLAGGWNRFAYGGGNPISFIDPMGLQSYMCAAGLPSWCQPPSKPPSPPPPPGFNDDPCVQSYLQQYYGSFVANTMVPNFSALSYIPGSGTAGQAWNSTAISVGSKGVFVGAPYAFSVGVEAMGVAGAGVVGGSTPSALIAAGSYAGATASAASGALAVFGAATLPFSSTANAMALIHCSCKK